MPAVGEIVNSAVGSCCEKYTLSSNSTHSFPIKNTWICILLIGYITIMPFHHRDYITLAYVNDEM
jgi:hypothetical protein